MKKKILSLITLICLSFSISASTIGCNKEAKIGEQDWFNSMVFYSYCPPFTLYEYELNTATTFSYYTGDIDEIINGDNCRLGMFVTEEFMGENIEDSKISNANFMFFVDMETQEIKKRTPVGGNWANYYCYGANKDTVYEEAVEYIAPPTLYAWIFRWAQSRYSQFSKSHETDSTITYSTTGDLSEFTAECQKTYPNASVKAVSLTFRKDFYSQDHVNDSSDCYKLDSIVVKGQDGLLFSMKDIDNVILKSEHDFVFDEFITLSNFTLKGGEGVDYGEYYFTKDSIRIYTPNNPNESQKEMYLIADFDNEKAKSITKTAQGSWDVQEISLGSFENRKQELIKVYLNGIINNGYGSLKSYSDVQNNDGYTVWVANEIRSQIIGYDITYKNVNIKFDDYNKIKEMTFDYVMSAGENSITHKFKLTDGGTTTVNAPQT